MADPKHDAVRATAWAIEHAGIGDPDNEQGNAARALLASQAELKRRMEALNSAPLQRCDWPCRNGDEDCETCKWVAKYKAGEPA